MKHVTAVRLTYDASVGRVEPGQTYLVEDDKAERWVNAGVATEAPPQPPAPDPTPTPLPLAPEPDDEGDELPGEEDKDPEELAAEAHKLHDEGLSERAIAQQLGISRPRVHSLLTG